MKSAMRKVKKKRIKMDEIADVKEKVTVESFIGSMATEMEKFSFEAEKEQK